MAWKVSDTYQGMYISGVQVSLPIYRQDQGLTHDGQGGMPYFTVLGDMFIKNHYVILSYGSDKQDNIQIGLGDRTDLAPIF